nr:unnamed protein product [Digitaria exilis]
MGVEPERDGEEQRRPLLSSSSPSGEFRCPHSPLTLPASSHVTPCLVSTAPAGAEQQYQFLGRSSSSVIRRGGGGGLGWEGPEVSAEEVRSAASFSSSAGFYPPPQASAPHADHVYPYPPSIHSAVISPSPSHAPSSPRPNEGLAIVPQGPYPYGASYQPSQSVARDVLDEVEIRQLLIEHVGHRCCWGSRPARKWKITSIEDCNVYVGTLETFIEERDIVTKKGPYESGIIDGRDNGPVLGVWELDLRSEFPLLFVPEKEVMVKIPHSEVIEKCSEVISSRLPVPPSARVISERHIISVVPVTRVTMAHRKQSFSFYVVGYNRDVFIRDYPSKFCWGLCCCFEWLGK